MNLKKLLMGAALIGATCLGCSQSGQSNSDEDNLSSRSNRITSISGIKKVKGWFVGGVLLPEKGESIQDYKGRLDSLNHSLSDIRITEKIAMIQGQLEQAQKEGDQKSVKNRARQLERLYNSLKMREKPSKLSFFTPEGQKKFHSTIDILNQSNIPENKEFLDKISRHFNRMGEGASSIQGMASNYYKKMTGNTLSPSRTQSFSKKSGKEEAGVRKGRSYDF